MGGGRGCFLVGVFLADGCGFMGVLVRGELGMNDFRRIDRLFVGMCCPICDIPKAFRPFSSNAMFGAGVVLAESLDRYLGVTWCVVW